MDHNGGIITSGHGDLRITIPENAIRIGDDVIICISTSLYGPYNLPVHSQTDLTTVRCSPYYWIGVSGSYRFSKPIQVEFEHFGACDPSHYQLLCCEDDDKSYTMKPVEYELSFTVRDDISWSTFQTYRCCSYCLFHKCKDHVGLHRIAALYLKPADLGQHDNFTVQIWFSFPIRHCLKRNKELYTKKGLILDDDCSCTFISPSDQSCKNYFELSYHQSVIGWSIRNLRFTIIQTEQVNFYNYYTDVDTLIANENISQFPPRFILGVTKNSDCKDHLNSQIKVSLVYDNVDKTKSVYFELFVPRRLPSIKQYATNVSCGKYPIPSHRCEETAPKLSNLIRYSDRVLYYWEEIAILLGIEKKIAVINRNNQQGEKKCLAMFNHWLESTASPCWCHFIQALYDVGLNGVAEEAIADIFISPATETVQPLEINVQEELIPAEQLKPLENSKLLESKSVPPSDVKVETAQTYFEGNKSVLTMTPPSISEGSSEIINDTLNLDELNRYLQHIPDNTSTLDYFIFRLFLNKGTDSGVNVIKDIKCNSRSLSKEDKVKKVCEAYLTVKNPSWTEVHRALEDAKCNDLATFVKAIFLT